MTPQPKALTPACRRKSRSTNTDVRALRTRRRLIDSLREILEDTTRSHISVTELIQHAHVSRSAFYSHFDGVDDVLWWLIQNRFAAAGSIDLRLRSEGRLSALEIVRTGLSSFISGLSEHKPLFRALFTSELGARGQAQLLDQIVSQTEQSIRLVKRVPATVDPRVAAVYLAGGELAAIGEWLNGAEPVGADELVDQLIAMMPPWLTMDSPP